MILKMLKEHIQNTFLNVTPVPKLIVLFKSLLLNLEESTGPALPGKETWWSVFVEKEAVQSMIHPYYTAELLKMTPLTFWISTAIL